MLRRLLGIRSPSREIGHAVASGMREGLREAEEAMACDTRPPPSTDAEMLERMREACDHLDPVTLARMRRTRDLFYPDDGGDL